MKSHHTCVKEAQLHYQFNDRATQAELIQLISYQGN